jgi:flagellar basal-body rod protein FlgC
MSNLPIFDIAGSALSAQSVRMSTIASNLANADSISGSAATAYKPLEPVFRAVASPTDRNVTTVQIKEVRESSTPPIQRYDPDNPMADGNGFVYAPDIDPVAQMVNLISSSRNYQAGVEVLNTAKDLALATLNMGR